jgi:hypothetical protein
MLRRGGFAALFRRAFLWRAALRLRSQKDPKGPTAKKPVGGVLP